MDDTSRLDRCGWSSFRPDLFLNEPGRLSRDLGDAFLKMLRDFSGGKRVLELCCGAGRIRDSRGASSARATPTGGRDGDEGVMDLICQGHLMDIADRYMLPPVKVDPEGVRPR